MIKGLFTLTGTSLKRLVKLYENVGEIHAGNVSVVFFIYRVVQLLVCSVLYSNSATSKAMGGWIPFMLEKLQAVENICRCCLYVL